MPCTAYEKDFILTAWHSLHLGKAQALNQFSMKQKVLALALWLAPLAATAQGWPSNYGGVMLQGFSWDSYIDTQWTNLEAQADDIAQYFDLIWVPQSGNCNTSYNNMGYGPVYWFDQTSSFGNEQQLRSLINTYKSRNVGIIADVVINHRGSLGVNGSWVDFPAETYKGVTYQLGLADICKDDDGGATAKLYDITGNNDTGEDWNGMRDLDHTSANVQNNVIAYLSFLKDDIGYAGFRYDMTKGYAATYTGLYNSTTNPTYSVGEYWDGNLTKVKSWIDGTKVNGAVQSAAFDFPTRYSIRDACNSNNWSKLSTKGLAGYDDYKRYAVTFVENHDTQYRSTSYQGDPISIYVEAANAYVLCTPGTPCVFLPHWKQYKSNIKQMINARKAAHITNQSTLNELSSTTNLYAAEVGGTLKVAIGSGSFDAGSGYTQVMSGNNYKVFLSKSLECPWVSQPSGTYESGFTATLTAISNNADARLVYTLDGSEPTAQSSSVASGGTVAISETTTLKVGLLTDGNVTGTVTRSYVIQPFSPHDATVYVKDPGWSSVYYYAWTNGSTTTELCGAWPGTQTADSKTINGEKWYYKSFAVTSSDYSFNVIFDQGMGKDQTVDIGPITSDKYYIISSTKSGGKYTVTDVTTDMSSIRGVTAEQTQCGPVKVYNISGSLLRTMPEGTAVSKALDGLGKGVFIVNKKKYLR